MYKMRLENFVILESKETLKEYKGYVKRIQRSTCRGSHQLKILNILNIKKNNNCKGLKHAKHSQCLEDAREGTHIFKTSNKGK